MKLNRSTAGERATRLALGRAAKAQDIIYADEKVHTDSNAELTLRFISLHDPVLLERIVDQCNADRGYQRSWRILLSYEMLSPKAGLIKEEEPSSERISFYLNRTRRSLIIVPLAHSLVSRLEPHDNRYALISAVGRVHRAATIFLDDRKFTKEETHAVTTLCVLRHMASGTSNIPSATVYKEIDKEVAYIIANHENVNANVELLFERNAYTVDFMESLISIETKPLMEGQL